MGPATSDEHKPDNDLANAAPAAPAEETTSDAADNKAADSLTQETNVSVVDPPAETEATAADEPVGPAPQPPVVTEAPASADKAKDASAETSETGQSAPAENTSPWQAGTVSQVPEGTTAASAAVVGGKKSRKKLLVTILAVVLGLLLIAGGAAFAYFGVVVPNKPENVLKNALYNTVEAEYVSFDSTVNVPAQADAGIPAMKIDFVSRSDATNQANSITVTLTVSGVDFSFEARMLDSNIYVKVGDLSTVKSLVSTMMGAGSLDDEDGYIAAVEGMVDEASRILSDEWIIIDSTLLDQANMSCVTDAQFALNENDKQILEEQFTKNPFAAITSHSSETVDGVEVVKYDITIDNRKGSAYAGSITDLSLFDEFKDCVEPVTPESGDRELSADDIIPEGETKLTVWVDKSASRIHKLALDDFELDAESEAVLDFETVLTYEEFTVTAPENPKPALQVLNQLQTLFNSDELSEALLGM